MFWNGAASPAPTTHHRQTTASLSLQGGALPPRPRDRSRASLRDTWVSLMRSRLCNWACWLITVRRSSSMVIMLNWKWLPLPHVLHQWNEYQGRTLMSWLLIRSFWRGSRQLNPCQRPERTYLIVFHNQGFPWRQPSRSSSSEHLFRLSSSCPGATVKPLCNRGFCLHVEYIRFMLRRNIVPTNVISLLNMVLEKNHPSREPCKGVSSSAVSMRIKFGWIEHKNSKWPWLRKDRILFFGLT